MESRAHTNGADPSRTQPAQAPEAGPAPHAAAASRVGCLGDLRLLAINHHSASLSGYERAALDPDQLAALNNWLEASGLDSVLLSTCNRVELYWTSMGAESDRAAEEAYRQATGAAAEPSVLLRVSGEQVAHHLFRVTCGLDSLLLGEGEVMGQVRDALETSGAGGFVSGVFRAALRCGGLARAETTIGSGALSVASAGALLVARAIAHLDAPRVVIVGAGQTGASAARRLSAEGVARLVIVNRTFERAQALARELGAEAAPLESLPKLLGDVDGAVVAAHTPVHLVTEGMAREAMASRPDRPLVVSDLSMPRAVDAAARSVPGVAVHDLLGLESLVRENLARRSREVPRVEAVIQRELDQLRSWAHQQMLRPVMAEFRQRAEAIRRAELRRVAGENLADAEVIDRLTRRLMDRLITIPITTMREARPKTFEACGLQCLRRQPEESSNGTD